MGFALTVICEVSSLSEDNIGFSKVWYYTDAATTPTTLILERELCLDLANNLEAINAAKLEVAVLAAIIAFGGNIVTGIVGNGSKLIESEEKG